MQLIIIPFHLACLVPRPLQKPSRHIIGEPISSYGGSEPKLSPFHLLSWWTKLSSNFCLQTLPSMAPITSASIFTISHPEICIAPFDNLKGFEWKGELSLRCVDESEDDINPVILGARFKSLLVPPSLDQCFRILLTSPAKDESSTFGFSSFICEILPVIFKDKTSHGTPLETSPNWLDSRALLLWPKFRTWFNRFSSLCSFLPPSTNCLFPFF